MEKYNTTMSVADAAKRYAELLCKRHGIKVTYEEDMLCVLDGWVYVEQRDIRLVRPSILGDAVTEVKGFAVTMAVFSAGSWDQPDDVDVEDEGEYQSLTEAIRAAILVVLHNELDQHINAISEDLWLKDSQHVSIAAEALHS